MQFSQFLMVYTKWMEIFARFHEHHELLNLVDALMLAISYYCLFQFGVNTIVISKLKSRLLNLIPILLGASWVLLVSTNEHDIIQTGMGDVFARYLLGLPRCFLTSYALAET